MQVNSRAVVKCESTNCAAYEFGKFHCLSNKVNTIKNNPMKEHDLKKDNLLPGQIVSADHYIYQDPGLLFHSKGKSDTSDMF